MEDWCIGPDLRVWFAVGYEVIFVPGICRPRLWLVAGAPPIAVLPSAQTACVWERMIAWCILELVQARVGWDGLAERLASYAYIAA